MFSRRSIRDLDRAAIDELGIPSIVLMENAAIGVAAVANEMCAVMGERTAVVVCGGGNNGGDGLAVARHLQIAGWRTVIVLGAAPAKYTEDAATNLGICRSAGLAVFESTEGNSRAAFEKGCERAGGMPFLLVDALLGTGATGAVRGHIGTLIGLINCRRKDAPGSRVLAIDLPSGMDADTGEPLGEENGRSSGSAADGAVVAADRTVTLVGIKQGFLRLPSQRFLGEVSVVSIGVPPELIARFGEPLASRAPAAHLRDDRSARERPTSRGPGKHG